MAVGGVCCGHRLIWRSWNFCLDCGFVYYMYWICTVNIYLVRGCRSGEVAVAVVGCIPGIEATGKTGS